MSPYSPFFNSGLLASPNEYAKPGSRRHHHPRRSSLPESTTYTSSSTSAYYVSLQRRDKNEYRSFLSLDLAESRLSERHGPQTASLIPPVPALPPLPVVSPLRSHFSSTSSLRSDSLRSLPLPDPKPAPSIMLPDPPPPPYSIHHTHQTSPPRLPELPVLPALQFPPTYTKARTQRPLPSPPSPVKPSHDPVLRSSVLTKPKHLRSKKPKNLAVLTNPNRLSKASVSTASTHVRRRNRWDALDALEGRRKPIPQDHPPFVPPVPKPKKLLKIENVFVKPTTFARPTKPTTRLRAVPNFINMSDDSDQEPNESDSSYSTVSDAEEEEEQLDTRLTLNVNSRVYLNPNLPLDSSFDPLLEPEDIVLPPPPLHPRPPSAELNTRSYLDVEEDEEEGIVLEATRCPPPLSPPPPTLVIPTQRSRIPPLKGTVKSPLKPLPCSRKDIPKPSAPSSSKHHHHPSSSKRHKASTSNATPRNNHSHYKSFIELDMDDLLDDRDLKASNLPKTRSRGTHHPEPEVELFGWRRRMGRGIAEGGGDWVWV